MTKTTIEISNEDKKLSNALNGTDERREELSNYLNQVWYSQSEVDQLRKELHKLILNGYDGGIIEHRDIDEVFDKFSQKLFIQKDISIETTFQSKEAKHE